MKQPLINYTQKPKSDEFFTPTYAIKPILKYLKPNSNIWCPFDKADSTFVKTLLANGHRVRYTHIDSNEDFLNTKKEDDGIFFYGQSCSSGIPSNVDYIISNPLYTIKDDVIQHLYKLGIPWIMLMPLTALEGKRRGEMFRKNGVQLLVFDTRVNYMKDKKAKWFNTSYFMWNVMPKDLVFHKLKKENTNE